MVQPLFAACALLALCPLALAARSAPVVPTTSGRVHGLSEIKSARFEVNKYLGIPYAQAPVGELRFQKPAALPQSDAEIDATIFKPTCIQHNHLADAINPLLDTQQPQKMSEDCLFLNVYAPAQIDGHMPVVVFFPGEGFDFADARQFDGSYLASIGHMIVVTVQYRVGAFGFLKLDQVAPGNMGLWDQIEALKWVQANIAAFGGDAEKVTAFGRFTGSMSLSILLTSPVLGESNPESLNLPLFQRAILSSGVAVSNWVFDKQPQHNAMNLLTGLGCTIENANECLGSKSATELLAKAAFGWKPTMDKVLVTAEPLQALAEGHFAKGVSQVMMGSNDADGSLCLLTHWVTQSKYYPRILADKLTERDVMEMVEGDTTMYMGGDSSKQHLLRASSLLLKSNKQSLREKYVDFCSELLVHSHSEAFSQLVNSKTQAKTFSYRFQHRAPSSVSPSFLHSAGHGDDIIFALGLSHKQSHPSAIDLSVTTKFIRHLSNFVSTGNPNSASAQYWPENSLMYIRTPKTHSRHNSTHEASCPFSRKSESIVTFFSSHDYSSWQLVNSLSL